MSSIKIRNQKIHEFVTISNVSENTARTLLSKHNYDLEAALDDLYTNRSSYEPPKKSLTKDTENKLTSIFKKFNDKYDANSMTFEGINRFLQEVKIDPQEIDSLVFAYKLDCKLLGVISKAEFLTGFGSSLQYFCFEFLLIYYYRISDMKSMGPALTKATTEILKSKVLFKLFYKWLFFYFKGTARSLQKETALGLWSLILLNNNKGNSKKVPSFINAYFVNDFLEFVSSDKLTPTISFDTWDQIFAFLTYICDTYSITAKKVDLTDLNIADDAWPVLVDRFIELYRKK